MDITAVAIIVNVLNTSEDPACRLVYIGYNIIMQYNKIYSRP